MIILKHVTIERFRLLREMNLHFPQRGSILIQGPNESGKSALLESIYFALYGEALSTERGKRSLNDLISYGASNAVVTLILAVGAKEIAITRTIERGKGQTVALSIRRLGMPEEEPITDLEVANESITAELGHMDGPALRNSCLLEQKGLDRLEILDGAEREAALRKLLGLEKLTRLTEQFKIEQQDEELLLDGRKRLHLAEMQAHIPELSQRLDDIEAALDAVTVLEDLDEIDLQNADIDEQEQQFEQVQSKRNEIKGRQARIQQLRRADATLDELITTYDEMTEARRQLPELEKQILDLERREREDLPKMERRVNELGELMRSFGTLQRMSNDLLSAVDTIKDLEQELKQHDEVKDDLKSLDEQVEHAQMRLTQAQQALHDLEERRRAGRPQLEARLQRMQTLSERLAVLRQLEDSYARRLSNRGRAEENDAQLRKVQRDLSDTEQELELVEAEAKQAQSQAESIEKRWRQLSVRRQIEEWQRLKGLSQGLTDAEQHVRVAHQQQEKLTQSLLATRASSSKYLALLCIGIVLFLVGVIVAFLTLQTPIIAVVAVIIALVAAGGAAYGFQKYSKARAEEQVINKQVQDAINRVGMMVAARETAVRMGGNNEALIQIEHEIHALGGNVPRSLDEAQYMLQQWSDDGESLADIQQRMREKSEEANAARNQVNVTMEAVASLRKERARLEEQLAQEGWKNIEQDIQDEQAAVERMQQEITMLAGQEGLPLPSINARLQNTSPFGALSPILPQEEDMTGVPELGALVESTIKATERELAALEGKLDLAADLASQVKIHQDALDVLLARQKVIEERNARYQTNSPAQQIERAREQQSVLRQALQGLQDSLRQRVKPMGIAFGQAAINNAEVAARKQLEELHIILGNKIMLQQQQTDYTNRLQECQQSLPELYKQLAKFSNTLGSWIVPLNPFAEALVALRTRCQSEIEAADEANIAKELEELQNRENASRAKIELCYQEISEAQDRIATMLTQRNRPHPRSYTLADIVAIWPLVGQYTVQDRARLEGERVATEQELTDLEEQELTLSAQLQTGGETLDLEQMRSHLEQLDRSYQTRKRGNELVKAVDERLMHKIVPRTEHYMRQILPLLTSGRYHDVRLTTESKEETAGPFQLTVWDAAAGEYVPKSALSGGAADQLSLALRLAFAIAALPRELNTAPGFVLLDEPLSSFDRGRTKALVDVVTGEVLSQHFEQIILISHSSAFDPTQFPYHVYMDNGLAIESNLPVVPVVASGKDDKALKNSVTLVTPAPAQVGVE
jgi:DNA repair exonuclease SbcCD ATPase subunit